VVLTENQLIAAISSSKLSRYDIVKHAIEWIHLNIQNEEFRRLDQAGIINKALSDVVTDVATIEKMKKLQQKMKKLKIITSKQEYC
jgi:hypothetical protein